MTKKANKKAAKKATKKATKKADKKTKKASKTAKAASRITKYERLQQARLITLDCVLSQVQAAAIESLTDDEVSALISTRAKLSSVFKDQTPAAGGIRMHCLLDDACQENG